MSCERLNRYVKERRPGCHEGDMCMCVFVFVCVRECVQRQQELAVSLEITTL